MPKIVAAGNNWEAVEVPGEFAKDSNLAFLSSFEELKPQGADQFFDRNLNPKKKIWKRKRDSDVKNTKESDVKNEKKVAATIGEEIAEKPKKKENTKNKKKKKKQIEKLELKENSGDEHDQSVHAPMTTDAVTVMETDQNNGTKKPKKLKKKKKLVEKKVNKRDETKSRNSGEMKADKSEPKKKKRKKTKQAENIVVEEITEDVSEDKMEQESVLADEMESDIVEDSKKTDLSSWIPFCLPEEIMKALNHLGFEEPTEIQKLVLPSACRDKLDVLGAAETGSGKTLAYAIPLVTRLLDAQNSDDNWSTEKGLRALVLAPTRELVVQIRKHLGTLLKYTKFTATSVVGGLSQQKQERLLKYKPEIVVATPGRFWAMAKDALPDSYLGNWNKLLCLVVDETDRMVEKGHFEELEYILSFIKSRGNEKRQSLVFSATLTFVHPAPRRLDAQQSQHMTAKEKIDRLIEIVGMRKERKVFDITREFGTAEALVETRMNCANLLEKDTNVLYLLTRYPGRTLIFMNSIDASRRLHKILSKLNPEEVPMMLHAKMIQKQRLKNLEKFAASPISVLLATDVAARGLDIRGVEHVIHYQVPKTAELYVHRSGRTARAMKRGLTVLLVDPQDAQFYRRICRNLNREKELPVFPTDSIPLFKALKERVRAATEVESLEHRIKKIASRESWFEKTAREADLLLDGREKDKKLADEDLIDLRRGKKGAEGKLRGAIATSLPRFDLVEVQKTRYVTPEVAASYGKTVTQNALSSYDESVSKEQLTKKNYRALVSTRHLRRFNDKKQRHKLKRK